MGTHLRSSIYKENQPLEPLQMYNQLFGGSGGIRLEDFES